MQLGRFRRQAVAGAREIPYYAGLFDQIGLDPGRLRYEDIARIPVTPKEAMRNTPTRSCATPSRPRFGR